MTTLAPHLQRCVYRLAESDSTPSRFRWQRGDGVHIGPYFSHPKAAHSWMQRNLTSLPKPEEEDKAIS